MIEVRTLNASQIAVASSPVEGAEMLANHIEQSLAGGESVCVRLHGLRGLSSSFFNALFERLSRTFGKDQIRERVRFDFETAAQEDTCKRSAAWLLPHHRKQ